MPKDPLEIVDEVFLFKVQIVFLVVWHILKPVIQVLLGFGLFFQPLERSKRVEQERVLVQRKLMLSIRRQFLIFEILNVHLEVVKLISF
jgi:hypothetical protein